MACFAGSANTTRIALLGVESRYESVILMGAGLLRSYARVLPEANGASFAPHIRVPKLLIQGRFDEAVRYETEFQPLVRLLPEPKRVALLDLGHIPPLEVSVPIVNAWLDETLGPVRRE